MVTQHQGEVLGAIADLTAEMGFPPTTREVADRLGLWNSSVHQTLLRLREQGLVTWEPNKSRTLVVTSDHSPTTPDRSA